MGGLLILVATLVPTLLWARLDNDFIWLMIFATLWLGAVGFTDDYLKVVKKRRKGLVARYKLAGQLGLGLLIGLYVYYTRLNVPGLGTWRCRSSRTRSSRSAPHTCVFVMIVITASSNAVNLTDGLDGLAIGLVIFCALAFAAMSYVTGHVRFSDYLNIPYIAGTGELTVYCSALIGAGLGFLWFNAHPAEVFMGDTGSLAVGGALGTLADPHQEGDLAGHRRRSLRGHRRLSDHPDRVVQAPGEAGLPHGPSSSPLPEEGVAGEQDRRPLLDRRGALRACSRSRRSNFSDRWAS